MVYILGSKYIYCAWIFIKAIDKALTGHLISQDSIDKCIKEEKQLSIVNSFRISLNTSDFFPLPFEHSTGYATI